MSKNKTQQEPVLKIVESITQPSPAFEGEVDPIQLLETLDECMNQLAKEPSEESIQIVNKKLKSWQIITVKQDDEKLWVTAPFVIHKITLRRSLKERMKHLLLSGGEWKSEFVYRSFIDVKSRTTIPLSVPISNETKNQMFDDKVSALFVTLASIHKTILNELNNGVQTIGIFERPNAVINMNKLRAWLEDNETHNSWDMKYTLETHDLENVINTATFSIAQ